MIRGLKINCDGSLDFFLFNSIHMFLEVNDEREVELLEEFYNEDVVYEIYGSRCGSCYNQFELLSCNPMDELYVVQRYMYDRNNYQNIDSQHFLQVYNQSDDLDEYLLTDELDYERGDYDYEDGWLIR